MPGARVKAVYEAGVLCQGQTMDVHAGVWLLPSEAVLMPIAVSLTRTLHDLKRHTRHHSQSRPGATGQNDALDSRVELCQLNRNWPRLVRHAT